MNTTRSTSKVKENENSQLDTATTGIEGNVVKDAKFEDGKNEITYSLRDCHLKIICEGRQQYLQRLECDSEKHHKSEGDKIDKIIRR
jgi:hypothetical protein